MVKIIDGIKQGIGIVFVLSIFVFGFYLVKGRNGLQATDGDTLTAAKWNELVSSSSGAPSGFVGAFNLTTCPAGRKPADGTNGTPDLRGEFIRGLDNGRGVDEGRVISSAQEDSINRNSFNVYSPYAYGTLSMRVYGPINGSTDQGGTAYNSYNNGLSKGFGNETRPRNVALLYCIKE